MYTFISNGAEGHWVSVVRMLGLGLVLGAFRIFVKTCNLFKANGIPVIDADIIARAWVEEGCREDILLESGELDRPKLGRIVFGDPSKLQLLNRSHNVVNTRNHLDLKRSKADIVIDNNGSLEDLHENFKVLDQVTKPLTWTEFWRSR
ncbi:putative dephospho-CoA kinase [Helianthus annuus]|uniref:Dephospho-CoA kinase n=1 Tax=Helianthus annuus TaxID=4232 RepID=A0A9K3NT91_HELAN|nr:putative dephospho-CoA kinase [Helianthus annuus]